MYDNVYYNPEKFGLEQVEMIDYSDGNYCFDYRIIWRELSTGKYYTARDSGCSCPTPFERFHSVSELEEFGEWVIAEAKEEARNTYYRGQSVTSFIESCRRIAGRKYSGE